MLGRWFTTRRAGDRVVVATKVGARTLTPGDPSQEHWQGLGREHLLADAKPAGATWGATGWTCITPTSTTEPPRRRRRSTPWPNWPSPAPWVCSGAANTAIWRIERARGIARAAGRPAYSCIQQRHSYLLPLPGPRQHNLVTEELIDYAEVDGLTLLANSPLLGGLYPRGQRPSDEYAHAANRERLAVLAAVARELDAPPSQVVLAWLLPSHPSILPIIGASSVAQPDELLAAMDVTLDDETMSRLIEAGRGTSPAG